jgi:C4-dicarboxylate-specific signal transduction histidine kinase
MRALSRFVLVLDLVAAGAASAAVLLGVGLPLASRGALSPRAMALLALTAVAVGLALGIALLFRAVAGPVDRIIAAAARLGSGAAGLPILHAPGEPEGHGLHRAAVAFERTAAALLDERSRLAAKVTELERANVALATARESLLRSEKLATVGRLAAGVAHEVGNPLGAIGGYAELARARVAGRGGDPELSDWLGRISGETGRIDRIVRELLDFARPAPVALGPVRVAEAVETALRLAGVQPRFREVEVTLALPTDLPPVRADAGRLSQLLLNLLLNAGDAMGGKGPLRISARAESGAVLLSLEDGGPGIADADLPRIFDPFFTTKPPGEGTGLGLSICHAIAESFGGEIRAANREGGGAAFTLVVPAA